MPKNSLEDLRNHLFQALENLSDPEQEITELDINKSKQITALANVIRATGAAELKYRKYFSENNGDEVLPFFEGKEIKRLT